VEFAQTINMLGQCSQDRQMVYS